MSRDTARLWIAITGYACFLALNSFSLWGFTFLPRTLLGPDAAETWRTALSVANILAFFLVAAIGARWRRLTEKELLFSATLTVSAGLILLLGQVFSPAYGLALASGACLGVGTTLLFFCWIRIFCNMGALAAKKILVFGSMISFAPFVLYLVTPSEGILFAVFVMAFATLVLLYCVESTAKSEKEAAEAERPTRSTMSSLFKPLLCIAMIGLIAAVISSVANAEIQDHPLDFTQQAFVIHLQNLASASIMGAVWLIFKKNPSITVAYTVVFPVIATTMLLFAAVPDAQRPALSFISSAFFVVFSMVVPMQSIAIAEKHRLPIDFVYGLTAGVLYLAEGIGCILIGLTRGTIAEAVAQPLVLAFLLLYACSLVMFCVLRKQRGTGMGAVDDAALEGDAPEHEERDILKEKAESLGAAYGLTIRQVEVLNLAVHGYDAPSIAKKLYISENTVRTHLKRIYTLLDVHSKQEIIDSLNAA